MKFKIVFVCQVYRHLKNGDVLLLNRQPTLHRPSIMAHKVNRLNTDTEELYNYNNIMIIIIIIIIIYNNYNYFIIILH